MNLSWVLTFFFGLVGVYMLWKREHFSPNTNVPAPCPKGYINTPSGDCKVESDIHDPR